jgi:PAS domain S-box-containing protein
MENIDLKEVAWWLMELPSGKVIFNKKKTDVLGYDASNFTHYKHFCNLIHPDDYDNVMLSMKNLIEGNSDVYKAQYRIKDANNNYKHFFDLGTVIEKDLNNNLIKIIGFAIDIDDKLELLADIENKNNRLAALLNALPDLVLVSTNDGIYTDYYAKDETKLLVPPQLFLGKHYSDILPKEISDKIRLCLNKLNETGQVQTLEYSLLINGEEQFFESRLVKCGNDEILSISRDITDRRKIYDELVKSKTKYEELYNFMHLMSNNITDMLWAKDLDKNYIFVNRSICENLLNAKDENEPIGKNDLFFAKREQDSHPDNPNWHTFGKLCTDSDEVTIKENKPMNFLEHGFIKGKYTYLDVHKAPLYDKNGTVIGVVGTARNITKQIKTNERLKILYRAFEQSQVSIVITDKDALIQYVNPAFVKITGYSLEEVLGKTPNILKSGFTKAEEYKEIWNKLTKGEDWSGIFLDKKKNGELIWVSANISPIKDDEGNITHFVAVQDDITEKVKLETELKSALKKSEEANRLKTNFLANINHELRTPLNGILGFAKILTEQLQNEEHLMMSSNILESAKRLSTTLNLIIDLANIEADNTKLNFEILEITDLVKSCFENYKNLALQKKLKYELNCIHRPIFSNLDKNYFIEIVNNLIDNAIKYTNEGSITIDININKQFNYFEIKISDTGIGIPKEKINIIWEAFRQISEGLNRNFEGTGLGLTIVKKATELMKGDVKVESEENKGSTFIVHLPLVNTEIIEKHKVKPALTTVRKDKLSILYVEDDEINQNVVKMFLKNNYIIDTCFDTQTALKMVKLTKYDIILMDINLGPGINGAELTQIIKKDPIYSNTPVIAVTAYTQEAERQEFFAKGCTHYLAKPFLKNDLISLLEKISAQIK